MIASCHDVFREGHHKIDCALCFLVFGPHPFFCVCSRFFFLHCFNATCLSPHKKILRVSIFWGHLTRVRVGVESVALYALPKKKPTFRSYIQNCIVLS